MEHIQYRLQYEAAAVAHFGTGVTGSCAGAHSSNGSRLTLLYAEPLVLGQRTQLWLMEMPALAAAAEGAIQAHDCVSAQNSGLSLQGV